MRILIDTVGTHSSTAVGCDAEIITTNSNEIASLEDDDNRQVELQVEWLYRLFIDRRIDLVIVEDSTVGKMLAELDVPVVSFV